MICGISPPSRRAAAHLHLVICLAIIALPAHAAQAPGLVRLVATPNPVVVGQNVTLTAGVTLGGPNPATGTITITDTVTCPGTANPTVATLGTITLGASDSATPGAGTLVVSPHPFRVSQEIRSLPHTPAIPTTWPVCPSRCWRLSSLRSQPPQQAYLPPLTPPRWDRPSPSPRECNPARLKARLPPESSPSRIRILAPYWARHACRTPSAACRCSRQRSSRLRHWPRVLMLSRQPIRETIFIRQARRRL